MKSEGKGQGGVGRQKVGWGLLQKEALLAVLEHHYGKNMHKNKERHQQRTESMVGDKRRCGKDSTTQTLGQQQGLQGHERQNSVDIIKIYV